METERFSYSKISCYKDCGFKFKLQYRDKQNCFVGSIATAFGSAIHECEEAIAKAIQAGEAINYIKLKNELLLKLAKIEKDFPEEYYKNDGKSNRNYKDKLYQYLTTGIYRLEHFMQSHPTYKIVGIEQKFNFIYDSEHSFTGAIDRVFYDTALDKYIIQDIKTYAVPVDKKDLATPLQFVVYTLAAKELWKAQPEQVTCQYDLPLVGLAQTAGTNGFIKRGKEKLEELFTKIKNEDWAPNPTPLCAWCNFSATNPNAPEPYRYMCPYFINWTRERPNFSKQYQWAGIEKHPIILETYLASINKTIQTEVS